MIKVYDSPLVVGTNGMPVNPEPDAVIVDGTEYRCTQVTENYCTKCGRWAHIVFAFMCHDCTHAYYSHNH